MSDKGPGTDTLRGICGHMLGLYNYSGENGLATYESQSRFESPWQLMKFTPTWNTIKRKYKLNGPEDTYQQVSFAMDLTKFGIPFGTAALGMSTGHNTFEISFDGSVTIGTSKLVGAMHAMAKLKLANNPAFLSAWDRVSRFLPEFEIGGGVGFDVGAANGVGYCRLRMTAHANAHIEIKSLIPRAWIPTGNGILAGHLERPLRKLIPGSKTKMLAKYKTDIPGTDALSLNRSWQLQFRQFGLYMPKSI